jgi:hypothetical protein
MVMANLHAKYEDCWTKESYVIEQTRKIRRTADVRTSRQTDGRTDGQADFCIPPYNFVVRGIMTFRTLVSVFNFWNNGCRRMVSCAQHTFRITEKKLLGRRMSVKICAVVEIKGVSSRKVRYIVLEVFVLYFGMTGMI